MPWMLQLPPGGGEEEAVTAVGSLAPSTEYILASYLPFVIVLVVAPLVGLTYLLTRALRLGLQGKRLTRPEGTLYSVYVLAGVLPLIGGGVILHKLILDYVYGYAGVTPWRFIWSPLDMERFLYVASLLEKSHFLAGLGLGLLLLLPANYRSYENWYLDAVVYGGNLLQYVYLSTKPLENFKYSSNYIKTYGATPGTLPFDLVAGQLYNSLAAGFIVGAVLVLATLLIARIRKRGPPRVEAS